VTISEEAIDPALPPPAGFTFFGQEVNITAPSASDPNNPLTLVFLVDSSLGPFPADLRTIQITKDGTLVPDCATYPGSTIADPAPSCVSNRQILIGGDLEITVKTTTASRWNFAVSSAGAFHDAGVKRVGSPHSVRLQPLVPDTSGPLTVVVASNGSNHPDDVAVYLALLPPGGSSNPGGCAPAGVLNLGVFNLLPAGKITVRIDPPWQCANPGAVAGLSWTLKAIADIHGDDVLACDTLAEAFNGACSAGLANDDDADGNNTKSRSRPIVVLQ